MSALTIRLPNNLSVELNKIVTTLHISRSEYIRRSIEAMNKHIKEEERKKQLILASHKVRNESMVVNKEFSKIENDPAA